MKQTIHDEALYSGIDAYKAGKPCVPVKDKAVESLIKKYPGNAIIILKAWHRGWSEANCAIPLGGEAGINPMGFN